MTRLEHDVAGLVLFARSRRAAAALSAIFNPNAAAAGRAVSSPPVGAVGGATAEPNFVEVPQPSGNTLGETAGVGGHDDDAQAAQVVGNYERETAAYYARTFKNNI
jgi:hypothetical protein